MGVNFNLLDTVVGDRVLNAAAIAAILAESDVALEVASIAATGNVGGATVAATGAVTGATVAATGQVSGAYVRGSVANSLTGVGTTRTDALQLAAAVNRVTTWAAGAGVVLPAVADVGEGGSVDVYNAGAGAGKVYALGSTTIDGTAGATGVTLTNALRCRYTVVGGAYVSAQLGAVSA